jgi:hypothetical protein
MRLRTYEIIFAGRAEPAVVTAFEECDVTVNAGTTKLTADGIDQAALHGLLDRLRALRLDLLEVRAADRPPQ